MAIRATPQEYFSNIPTAAPAPRSYETPIYYAPPPNLPDNSQLIILALVLGVSFLALLAFLAVKSK